MGEISELHINIEPVMVLYRPCTNFHVRFIYTRFSRSAFTVVSIVPHSRHSFLSLSDK